MSKYTEAAKLIIEEHRQYRCWTEESFEAAQKIKEACRIADRPERADKISNKEIHIKACKKYGCWRYECPCRDRDMFCSDMAEIFFDGYEEALKDIRGDYNG